ncbi:hypothetical protein Ddye_019036 [Dipteronia dyeriana]|uniref:Uncharacterized protein n=1 Tax=Dipteronia dyeriana TaxID=168575 RepID=A0AAD9TX84_9ROSI|nr:hypothetical protein Ddye_019036 [Dipteronia dyeriana]
MLPPLSPLLRTLPTTSTSSSSSSSAVTPLSLHPARTTIAFFHGHSSPSDVAFVSCRSDESRLMRSSVKSKEKELELNVSICIEDELPDDPEISSIAELLRLNAPMLMKSAFDSLRDSEYKTRDTAIEDIGGFGSIELSILLCNDEFIRKLIKAWRNEDHATDVLSMSQHVPELKLPILMLSDIVISVRDCCKTSSGRRALTS